MSDLGQYQNSIPGLPTLTNLKYENIFKIYQNKDGYYTYNPLNTIAFPGLSDNPALYTVLTVTEKMPLTVISYKAYGTIDLWWLIALINQVKNPFEFASTGTVKILKPQYVSLVISQISQSLA